MAMLSTLLPGNNVFTTNPRHKCILSQRQSFDELKNIQRKSPALCKVLTINNTKHSQTKSDLRKDMRWRVRSQSDVEPTTIDNSSVLVIGGGGLGMEVVRKFAKDGSWVTAFQRGEKFRKEIEDLGAMLAIGDVLEPLTIEKTLKSASFDAIVCTVGGGNQNLVVDKDGPINLIQAAKKFGVKRFLLVSSIGVGDSVVALPEQTLKALKPVLEAKAIAEEALKSSGLDYTIIRPGGLLNGPPSGKWVLTEDPSIIGLITRGDVASIVAHVLFRKEAEGKVLSVIDPDRLLPPTVTLEGVKLVTV